MKELDLRRIQDRLGQMVYQSLVTCHSLHSFPSGRTYIYCMIFDRLSCRLGPFLVLDRLAPAVSQPRFSFSQVNSPNIRPNYLEDYENRGYYEPDQRSHGRLLPPLISSIEVELKQALRCYRPRRGTMASILVACRNSS